MSGPLNADLARVPYPERADQEIRKAASFVPWDLGVVRTLDMIKNELFGDAEKAEQLARQWAQCTVMANSREEIQNAKTNLAGLWEGPAYQQFDQYAGSVVLTLNNDHAAVTEVGKTLGDIVQVVYDTYADAIRFVGNCAADLGGLGGYGLLAVSTAAVPGVDIVTAGVFLTKLIDTLSGFVKNVDDLVSASVSKVGNYKSSATSLQASANSFQMPSRPGGEVAHSASWLVAGRSTT